MERPADLGIGTPGKRHWTALREALVRTIHRLGYIAQHRIITYSLIAGAITCGLIPRFVGLERSLWFDEAWVANSTIAPTLSGVFYYDSHLQVSPPLFLLLVRSTVGAFGLSNSVFRYIPILMALASVVAMAFLARRLLSRRYALFAWTLFLLSPVAIAFSSRLKPFTSELAAATVLLLVFTMYMDRPTTRRFWLLVATVVVGLLIAYPVAFTLPGIILAVCLLPGYSPDENSVFRLQFPLRGIVLGLLAGATLLIEYYLFILPNSSAALEAFWWGNYNSRNFLSGQVMDGNSYVRLFPFPDRLIFRNIVGDIFIATLFLASVGLAYREFRRGRYKWLVLQVVCGVPSLLVIISHWFAWYPISRRTSLFLLPFLVVLIVYSFQSISTILLRRVQFEWLQPLVSLALVVLMLLAIVVSALKSIAAQNHLPEEDVASAVLFLREHVQPSDLVWVHASCSESFRLYTRMMNWNDAPAKHGNTGWPCCPRGELGLRGVGSEEAVRADFNSGIPETFRGRVWLLHTLRPGHWSFVGLEEPKVISRVLRERGCTERQTTGFLGIEVSGFDC